MIVALKSIRAGVCYLIKDGRLLQGEKLLPIYDANRVNSS